VTVCVATLFTWNLGTLDKPAPTRAAIVMADRKITSGDIEYEPSQQKIAFITPRALITVAGDLAAHSEAIRRTLEQLRQRSEIQPYDLAAVYGQSIQSIRQKQAEDKHLSPLGLNLDMFLSQQREYSDWFVERITNQMQGFVGPDVEALVAASDGLDVHIFHVDHLGTISNMSDLGFAAIGIGAWHARSRLMQSGYSNTANFARAVTETFAAKKSAEIAPGVGKFTDAYALFKTGIEPLRSDVYEKCKEIYEVKTAKRATFDDEAINELGEYISKLGSEGVSPTEQSPINVVPSS
jgi:20S proteasome alpha/beta subunit